MKGLLNMGLFKGNERLEVEKKTEVLLLLPHFSFCIYFQVIFNLLRYTINLNIELNQTISVSPQRLPLFSSVIIFTFLYCVYLHVLSPL